MAQIKVNDLTFCYEGSFDDVLSDVNFSIDTDWKLGLIGRNGKGKTTLLNLFLGKYEPTKGNISSGMRFDYFPYDVSEEDLLKTADELIGKWKPEAESWQVMVQMNQIGMDAECLYRPFNTLSFGERTRVMLAVLFALEGEFLLIDEPTNHLDSQARELVKKYLAKKKGFILVSHDRDLLDAVCDHVLVLNRKTIEVQTGNFSSWWENKEKADAFAKAENEKHLKEIGKLKAAADRADRWAEKNENTKIGFDPIKEHDRCMETRAYIGAKTKKMQSRVKNFEKRIEREIEEKEGLLKDIESVDNLKLMPLKHHKKCLVECRDFSLRYVDASENTLSNLTFQLLNGDILFLSGENGCGKSTLIKAILSAAEQGNIIETKNDKDTNMVTSGSMELASELTISYVNQDASKLTGSLKK
jgi:lincosamide and streptogramin A transport system ATP-binding/permease protein